MGYLNVDPRTLGSTADYRRRGFDIAPQASATPGLDPNKDVVTRGLPANLRVDAGLGRSTAFDISPQATATPGPWDRVTYGLPVNLRLDAGFTSPYERRLAAERGLGCDCIGPVRANMAGMDFGKHFAIPGPLGQPTAMAVYEASAQRDPSLIYLTPTGNTGAHGTVRMGSAAQAGVVAVGQGPGNGVGYAQRKGVSAYVPTTTESVPSYARRRLRLGSGMGKGPRGPVVEDSLASAANAKADEWHKSLMAAHRRGEIMPTVTPAGAVESNTPTYETTEWGMFGMGGPGDATPEVVARIRGMYKRARQAATDGNQPEAEKLFGLAEGDTRNNKLEKDPRVEEEREWARQAVVGSFFEKRAAQADTAASRTNLMRGASNAAQKDSQTGAFAGSLWDSFKSSMPDLPSLPWYLKYGVPTLLVGGVATYFLAPSVLGGIGAGLGSAWRSSRRSNPSRKYRPRRRVAI